MIQRRWYIKLRQAISNQQRSRKRATESAIFRFLSLQRKALMVWRRRVELWKREKMQGKFALTLYYTRTIDKAFSGLRMYAQLKEKKRQQRENEIHSPHSSDYVDSERQEISMQQRKYY
jgi:hypothetical protein